MFYFNSLKKDRQERPPCNLSASSVMDAQDFGVVADDFFGELRVVVELDAEAGNKLFQTTFP